jgi:proline iminopeptidase
MTGWLWAQPKAETPELSRPSGMASGERRLVMSDGATLFVKVSGKGPACLFVHGGPGQGSFSFEKMGGDALESFLTMIYVDQRGSGKSPDARDYHLERLVLDLEEVRKDLKQERLILLAHSFGGILATAYAQRFPEHVGALVMANASLHFKSPANRRMQIDVANRWLGKQTAAIPDADDSQALAAAHDRARSELSRAGLGYRFLTEHLETLQTMITLDNSYPRSMGFGRAVMAEPSPVPEYQLDHTSASRLVQAPVLVITGSKDYAVGPDQYKTFHFPDQAVVTLEAGHLPYYENTQEFTAAIRGFIHKRLP